MTFYDLLCSSDYQNVRQCIVIRLDRGRKCFFEPDLVFIWVLVTQSDRFHLNRTLDEMITKVDYATICISRNCSPVACSDKQQCFLYLQYDQQRIKFVLFNRPSYHYIMVKRCIHFNEWLRESCLFINWLCFLLYSVY